MLKKIDRRYIIIGASIALVVIIIIAFICKGVSKKKMTAEETKNVSSNTMQRSVESATSSDVKTNVENAINTDSENDYDSDDTIKPIDCNLDFWTVKYGIAECYDHIFKKNHLHGTTYYQGDCEEHEPTEINELARNVKLYRDDNNVYTAVLPELGWTITLEDAKLKKIIDAQIEGNGEAYSMKDVAIVMYFYDNTLFIESVNEE